MNNAYIVIGWPSLALVASLIIINGAISVALQLGLERKLAIGAVRVIVQLMLVGYVLKWVFEADNGWAVLAALCLMTWTAGHAAASRGSFSYKGVKLDALISVSASSWLITGIGLWLVIHIQPWYAPQYAIPITGMVLGNTLTAVSLGMDRITGELAAQRLQIDAMLTMGATRWEAFRPAARQAVRAGMMPVINAMNVVGIVSLPGMMTGQVLGGQPPEHAIRYQIVIMFLTSASSGIGIILAVLLAYRRLFSSDHCFEFWKLQDNRLSQTR